MWIRICIWIRIRNTDFEVSGNILPGSPHVRPGGQVQPAGKAAPAGSTAPPSGCPPRQVQDELCKKNRSCSRGHRLPVPVIVRSCQPGSSVSSLSPTYLTITLAVG
jgi:hypothetical protein